MDDNTHEHDEFYLLMMESLDGELSADSEAQLDAHLQLCTTCRQEWQALQAIELLLRRSPILMPATDFAQRTLARLPGHRYRRWSLAVMYVFLLLGGLLPVLVGGLLAGRYIPVITQTSVVANMLEIIAGTANIIGAVLSALINGLGEFIWQQPAIIGLLLILLGSIALWGGVYQQLVLMPQTVNRQHVS